MSTSQSHISENAAEREHLIRLVNKLTDEQLAYTLEAGWTAAAVLAHLAFWDHRALVLLGKWAQEGIGPSPIDTDLVNEVTRVLCLAIPPRAAAELAVERARAIDAAIERLSPPMVADVVERGKTVRLNRAHHRRDHLRQIEQALGIAPA